MEAVDVASCALSIIIEMKNRGGGAGYHGLRCTMNYASTTVIETIYKEKFWY